MQLVADVGRVLVLEIGPNIFVIEDKVDLSIRQPHHGNWLLVPLSLFLDLLLWQTLVEIVLWKQVPVGLLPLRVVESLLLLLVEVGVGAVILLLFAVARGAVPPLVEFILLLPSEGKLSADVFGPEAFQGLIQIFMENDDVIGDNDRGILFIFLF